MKKTIVRSIGEFMMGVLLGLILIALIVSSACTAQEIPAHHKLHRCIKITEYDYVTQDRKDTFNTWTHYYSQFKVEDTIP